MVASLALLRCGGEPSPSVEQSSPTIAVSLIDHQSWKVVDAASDPLASHRPAIVLCDDLTSWGPEVDYVEVDTGRCNYLMLQQPALASGKIGDHVKGKILYFDLTAPAPAEGHVAVVIGSKVIAERTVAIPGSGDVFLFDEILTAPLKRGDPVYLHVHNHGQNNWRLYDLSVAPGP